MSEVKVTRREVMADTALIFRFDPGLAWSLRIAIAAMLVRAAARVLGASAVIAIDREPADRIEPATEPQPDRFDPNADCESLAIK